MITVQEQLHNALKLIDADTALIERQSKRIEELEAQLAAPEQSNSHQIAVKQPAQGERQPVAWLNKDGWAAMSETMRKEWTASFEGQRTWEMNWQDAAPLYRA